MKKYSLYYLLLLFIVGFTVGCGDDEEMKEEEEEEVISRVILTFTPDNGGESITATWLDADGEGSGNPEIEDINLASNTQYALALTLANTLGAEEEDVTEEIEEEAAEHMFFFEFTSDIFSSPTGDGNFDSRQDAVNYSDQDDNNNPVGLLTSWTTAESSTGNFRVVLKHQPELKTESSDATVGGTDVDITFALNIQ